MWGRLRSATAARRDSNLRGRSWRYLLTGDETIIQPAMNSGSVDSQDLRSFANRCQLPPG